MDKAKHEMLCDLKRVASDLGRAPSRDEYMEQGKYSRHEVVKQFGGFAPFLMASGLDPCRKEKSKKKKEEIKSVFDRDIRSELSEYHSKYLKPMNFDLSFEPIMVVGDTHFPFVSMNSLSLLYALVEVLKPRHVVQVGDLYDMLSHSRFPRSRNAYNPFEEMSLGFEMSQEFWRKIKNLSPGVKCYQILGNHDVRPLKKILEHYPEGEVFFSIDRYFQFEGVQTIMDPRELLMIQGIGFTHGHGPMGSHRDATGKNNAHGHTHKGGSHFKVVGGSFIGEPKKTLWELDAGFLGDPNSKALSYTPLKVNLGTEGVGWIDALGPRFIPFLT